MALAPLGTRVKKDPALLARALRDPGLRSKLPDQYLTPQQRAARAKNQALAALGDISTPLSGPAMVNAAQQLVGSEFAPLLAGLGKRETIINKSADTQGAWAKRYYGDLNQLLGSIGGAQAGANDSAVKAAGDQGSATQAAIVGAADAAHQRMAADAAVRGGLQADAPAELATQTAGAQQAASQEAARAQTSAQQFGDATAAFMRGLQGASAQQGGEYQQQITGARTAALNDLGQQRNDLETKQAGTLTDTLLKLRGGEQQNAITAAGLGLDQAKLAASTDAAAGAEGRKYGYTPSEWLKLPASTRTAIVSAAKKKSASDQGYGPGRVGMNKYGYTYEEWTKMSPADQAKARAGKGKPAAEDKPTSGPGSLTSAAESKIVSQINKAYAALADPSSFQIATVVNGNATYRPAKTAQEVLKALKSKLVDPRVLNVARSLLHNGGSGIGQFGLENAHDLGIHVSPHWKVIRGDGDTSMTTNGPGR